MMLAGRRLGALAVLVAFATACGSTVPAAQQAVDGPGTRNGDATTPDAVTAPGADLAPVPDAGVGRGTDVVGGPVPGFMGGGSAPRGAVPGGVRDALAGSPGVTATTIKIGIELEADQQATRTAFGVNNVAYDWEPAMRAIIADLNRRGGLAGRKIEPVFAYTDLKAGTFDEQAQTACSTFTEDNKVFAAMIFIDRSRSLASCLAKNRTVALQYYNHSFHALEVLDRLADYIYLPAGISYPRAGFVVDALVEQQFFTKTSKIGLISWDDPVHLRYVNQVIKPRFAAHGLKVAQEAIMYATPTLAGLGQSGADMSSAVLKFKTEGIDRVFFAATGGVGPLFFMPAAESQGYRPRYGMGSMDSLESFRSNIPAAQLEGMRGAAWYPMNDLSLPSLKDAPPNADRTRCADVLRKANVPMPPKTQEVGAGFFCSPWLFLKQALARMLVGAPTFRAAVQGLGTGFADPATFPTRYGAGRRNDGVAAYRYVRYDAPCACFRYHGPVRSIP